MSVDGLAVAAKYIGKSMVRGGAAGGGSRLGGLAGGAALGGALANEDDDPTIAPDSGGIVSSTAPELDSPSAVPGQSSLGQYTDGEAPEQAAYGGQGYSESDATSVADAETTDELGEGLREMLSDDEFSKLKTAINDVEDGGNNYLKAAINDGVKGAIGGAAGGIAAGPGGAATGALAGFGAGAVKGLAGEAGGSIAVNWRDDNTNFREAFTQEIKNTKAGAVYSTLTSGGGSGSPKNPGGAMSGQKGTDRNRFS